jgi:hypothetical protein
MFIIWYNLQAINKKLQKILALGIIFGLAILMTPNITSGQSSSDIEIKANLKKGDIVETNLWFQTTNMTLGQGNEICPKNDCKYEFQDVTLNEFGNDRYISGTLKIEDKSSNSTQGNFTSFNYYDLSGNFALQNSKESPNQKILYYVGDLGIEKKSDLPSKLEYKSKITITEPANTLVLIGTQK